MTYLYFKRTSLFQYVALVLASIVLQGGIHYKTRQIEKEWARDHTKYWTLPQFEYQEQSVKDDIQRIQQDNRCCAVDSWKDYRKDPMHIPSSCCSKYKKGSDATVGQCSVDELEHVPGCGDRLSVWLWDKWIEEGTRKAYAIMNFWRKIIFFLNLNSKQILYTLKALITILSAVLITSIGKRNVQKSSSRIEMVNLSW